MSIGLPMSANGTTTMADQNAQPKSSKAPHAAYDKRVWSVKQGELLLDLYDAKKEQFNDPSVRKIGIWNEICSAINKHFKTDFTPDQCHQKLRNFKNDFQKVMMLEKKDCRHFERLHKIFLQSAAKPLQSPAALKRKLCQLAGPKSTAAEVSTTEKRPRIGLPDFRSRKAKVNSGTPVSPSKHAGSPQMVQLSDVNIPRPRLQPEPNQRARENLKHLSPRMPTDVFRYETVANVLTQPSVRNSYPQAVSSAENSVKISGRKTIDEKPQAQKAFDGINTNAGIQCTRPTMMQSNRQSKATNNLSSSAQTKELTSTTESPSNYRPMSYEETRNEKVHQGLSSRPEKALPVPINYYSERDIDVSKIFQGKSTKQGHTVLDVYTSGPLLTSENTHVVVAPVISSSAREAVLQNDQSSRYSDQSNQGNPSQPENTSLKFIKHLFNNSTDKEQQKTPSETTTTAANTCTETQSNTSIAKLESDEQEKGHHVIDLTESSLTNSMAEQLQRISESIDKWRDEGKQRENARVARERLREKRQEERHQESMQMTIKFVDLFESLVKKIGAIGE